MLAPQPRSRFLDSLAFRVFGVAMLVALLTAAYANSFRVPFLLDDTDSIPGNVTVRNLAMSWLPPAESGVTTSGRPLLNVSFAINYAIHGNAVFGYHVGNLLIHVLATVVLWGVVRRTLLQPVLAGNFSEVATPLAWWAAALWALHPLQTESVTYVVQRAESLVGLCYLLTLYGFIRVAENPSGRFWTVFTVFACLAGMAAKEVMASAPLIVLLYDRTFISGNFAESWRRHRRLHATLAATWLLLLACMVQSGGRGGSVGYEQVAWWEYALTQAPAIVGYVWRTVWPANLIFDYGAVVEKNPALVAPALVAILAALIASVHALRRWPVAGFAAACFFLILAPTSSVVPVATQTVAEHRMYLPLAALVIPVVVMLHRIAGRATWLICFAMLLAAGWRTHLRNHDYRDPLVLWADTAARVPDSPRARNNYGATLFDAGRMSEALTEYTAATELAPPYAEAWHNRGRALGKLDRHDEAIAALRRAIELEPEKAGFHASLGNALAETAQIKAAITSHREALRLAPSVAVQVYNLANTLMKSGEMAEAGTLFSRAREMDASDPEILGAYAVWLRRANRASESVAVLEESRWRHPQSARLRSHLGVSLIAADRREEGVRELEAALALDPNLPQTRYHLGIAYAEAGRPVDAIGHFEALLRLSSPTAELYDNLGTLYAQVDRYADAAKAFEQALALDPAHQNARRNLEVVRGYLSDRAR